MLWSHLTQPVADVRRSTLTVLPVVDTAVNQPPSADEVDVRPHDMPRIKPGTVIGSSEPADSSHLVLSSVPRVADGDVGKVPPSLERLVSLFHLTIVADVAADSTIRPPRYRLNRVAIGLATDVEGRETIVSTKSIGKLVGKLGFVERRSLAGNEACLDQALQVARTATMLVFDATRSSASLTTTSTYCTVMRCWSLRRGANCTLCVWALKRDDAGQYHLVDGKIRLLAAGLKEDRKLYVDAGLFVFGLPSQEAFAPADLPLATIYPSMPSCNPRQKVRCRPRTTPYAWNVCCKALVPPTGGDLN